MKRFFLIFIVALSACKDETNRVVVDAVTPQGRAFHFMPIIEDGVTDITIKLSWPSDWAFRPDTNPAVPYVAAQTILSGGTDALSPQDVLEFMEERNAVGSIQHFAGEASGELSFPKEHTAEVVALANTMIRAPQFDPRWVERTKSTLLANQTEFLDMSANRGWAAARIAVFQDHPIVAHLNLSDLDAITAVTPDDLRAWHTETFTQTGMTVVVTGAISVEDAGQAVDALLAGLPAGEVPQIPRVDADFSPKTVLLRDPDAEKTMLGFLAQLPPTSAAGEELDTLAIAQFGEGAGSPLFDAVRTELRASYGFQAGVANYTRDLRVMFIAGEVEIEKLAQARDVVLQTYAHFRAEPDFDGFDELRARVADKTRVNVQYVDVVANTILQIALDGKDPSIAPQLNEVFESATPEAVKARLQDMFPAASDLIVIAVSADEDALPGACVITRIKEAASCP